ncbi:MAG TPA: ABC transporter ATP-binding protein [Tepidisphaeraceae bacterium]|jgi:phospholipid/cholesterol/gamma-HCH transport system ATP-binding protein|nr:ABC transporter ATP-binding protein [Tepidisphaeraceae bacterium]
MALIEFKDVSKRFGKLVVLDQVDLRVKEGESLVIIGASGSGKSVMLKHMVGLLRPDSGEVWFDQQRIDELPERKLAKLREQFGFLFQMGALFDSMNVQDNVGFPLVQHTDKTDDEISRLVDEKLRMVGLPEVRKKVPAELSGGQRKRVALARAIALDPRVILYDEPTTGLDPIRSDIINELIIKLQRELKVTSVVVTHDMHSAFKIADRIVMLDKAKLIFDGTPQEIRESEDPVVHRFVTGEASEEELAGLKVPVNDNGNKPQGHLA